MKRILRCLFLLSLTASLLTSCVRDVVLDAGEKPTVVVECVLNNSDTQELRLNFTKGASKTEADSLTEAVATLIDLTESQTVGQFKRQKGDLWTLDYSAVPEHKYRLEVQVPGYDLIWAEDTMPKIDVKAAFIEDFDGGPLAFGISNPKDEYKTAEHVVYLLHSLPDVTYIYGMNYNQETNKHEIAEYICTDYPHVDVLNLTGGIYDPEVKDTLLSDDTPYILWDMCVAPPLRGRELHKRFLRIEKKNNHKKDWLMIAGSFKGEFMHDLMWWHPEEFKVWEEAYSVLKNDGKYSDIYGIPMGYISFMGVSYIYDQYLQQAFYFQQQKESTDMTSIYLRDNLPTNINEGIGIFGSMVEDKMQYRNDISPDYSERGTHYIDNIQNSKTE